MNRRYARYGHELELYKKHWNGPAGDLFDRCRDHWPNQLAVGVLLPILALVAGIFILIWR